ncbi:MAG TPA: DUF2461 domain-containing protein [Acidobacteriaceae bacterium]|nr:DUF2461 domain-containing protein [Acidobacteriaceae bacterium]
MAAHFSADGLKFLRGLARHNDRAWFDPRKAVYEREVKAPMLALIEEVNHALAGFAPEHVREPRKAMLRIYRDTRFAADKRPYKTNVAAWWVRRGFVKTTGAGFYFHVSAKETVIAAGAYMLPPDQLLGLRRHIEAHAAEFRALLAAKKLRAAMAELEGPSRQRVPRGFARDSPAADLLLQTRWGVSTTLPADAATEPGLVREIVRRFRLAAPLIEFLNAGIAMPASSRQPEPFSHQSDLTFRTAAG